MKFINSNYKHLKKVRNPRAKNTPKVLIVLDPSISYIPEPCLLPYLGVSKHGYSNG